MLTIRLQRVGKKKHPTYRLIVSEKARDTFGTYLEHLGSFDPHAKENKFAPNADRVKYWISKGAQTSDTVHNLLVNAGIIQGAKKKSVYLTTKRKAKLAEKSAQGGSSVAGSQGAPAETAPEAAPAPEAALPPEPAAAPETPPAPAG